MSTDFGTLPSGKFLFPLQWKRKSLKRESCLCNPVFINFSIIYTRKCPPNTDLSQPKKDLINLKRLNSNSKWNRSVLTLKLNYFPTKIYRINFNAHFECVAPPTPRSLRKKTFVVVFCGVKWITIMGLGKIYKIKTFESGVGWWTRRLVGSYVCYYVLYGSGMDNMEIR